jgi:lysozyme
LAAPVPAWERVADDDIQFAYIKATEGGDFTDARFVANWEAAAAACLDRGAYHFFTLCALGKAQARHFLSLVPDDPDALPPAVDLELAGNCSDRPDNAEVQRELSAFLHLVDEATGEEMLLYVGDDFERRYQCVSSWTGRCGTSGPFVARTSAAGSSGR